MNCFSNKHVYFLNSWDIENLSRSSVPSFNYRTKIVFNPSNFISNDTEDLCQFFLLGSCRFMSKCKKYHPESIEDSECMLCKVKIKSSLRKFGLLSGCQDIFCYPCIRQWRSRGNVIPEIANSCPVCGIMSDELISSSIFPVSFSDKLLIIQNIFNKSQKDLFYGNNLILN